MAMETLHPSTAMFYQCNDADDWTSYGPPPRDPRFDLRLALDAGANRCRAKEGLPPLPPRRSILRPGQDFGVIHGINAPREVSSPIRKAANAMRVEVRAVGVVEEEEDWESDGRPRLPEEVVLEAVKPAMGGETSEGGEEVSGG